MIPIATGFILLGGGLTAYLFLRSARIIKDADFATHVAVALEMAQSGPCVMCCIEALEALEITAPEEAV